MKMIIDKQTAIKAIHEKFRTIEKFGTTDGIKVEFDFEPNKRESRENTNGYWFNILMRVLDTQYKNGTIDLSFLNIENEKEVMNKYHQWKCKLTGLINILPLKGICNNKKV